MDSSSIALICFAAVTVTILAIYLVVRDISGAGTSNSGNFAKRPRLRRIRNVFDQEPSNSILGKIDQSFDRLVLENGSELTPFTAFLLIVACGLAIGGAIFVYSDQPLAGIAGYDLWNDCHFNRFAFSQEKENADDPGRTSRND